MKLTTEWHQSRILHVVEVQQSRLWRKQLPAACSGDAGGGLHLLDEASTGCARARGWNLRSRIEESLQERAKRSTSANAKALEDNSTEVDAVLDELISSEDLNQNSKSGKSHKHRHQHHGKRQRGHSNEDEDKPLGIQDISFQDVCKGIERWEKINRTFDLDGRPVEIVQRSDFEQRIFYHECSKPDTPCVGIMPRFESRCEQDYGWMTLLHHKLDIEFINRPPQWGVVAVPLSCSCKILPKLPSLKQSGE
ncbi:unnamed protein product [Darwinula stevensoni]|uniref:Spaetzle domain-containing protein n=1 Tax=Darwinula stevensoni TaxID=69355 RepID=A0A7R8X5W5_9CRUS|nr:unnamed protein product [Darwinula stevensoni]CAG0887519.1 unnamed protein product [Darwinula stevensoni]